VTAHLGLPAVMFDALLDAIVEINKINLVDSLTSDGQGNFYASQKMCNIDPSQFPTMTFNFLGKCAPGEDIWCTTVATVGGDEYLRNIGDNCYVLAVRQLSEGSLPIVGLPIFKSQKFTFSIFQYTDTNGTVTFMEEVWMEPISLSLKQKAAYNSQCYEHDLTLAQCAIALKVCVGGIAIGSEECQFKMFDYAISHDVQHAFSTQTVHDHSSHGDRHIFDYSGSSTANNMGGKGVEGWVVVVGVCGGVVGVVGLVALGVVLYNHRKMRLLTASAVMEEEGEL